MHGVKVTRIPISPEDQKRLSTGGVRIPPYQMRGVAKVQELVMSGRLSPRAGAELLELRRELRRRQRAVRRWRKLLDPFWVPFEMLLVIPMAMVIPVSWFPWVFGSVVFVLVVNAFRILNALRPEEG